MIKRIGLLFIMIFLSVNSKGINNDLNIILKGTILSKSNSYCLIKYENSDNFLILTKGTILKNRFVLSSVKSGYIIFKDKFEHKKYKVFLGYNLNINLNERTEPVKTGTIFKTSKSITKKRFTIKHNLLKKYIENPTEILYSASAVPDYEGNTLIGYKIKNIKKGSIIEKFGIMNGDIILKVNGIPTTDINSIFSLYGKINSIKYYSILIKRNGKIINLYYQVKN